MRDLRLAHVRALARRLMAIHGLHWWSFRFNRSTRHSGRCYFLACRIELSVHYAILNDDSLVTDTILHEIAHALVGAAHEHDEVWASKCVEIGCTPSVHYPGRMPAAGWEADCPACRKKFDRHKPPKEGRFYFCPSCGPLVGTLAFLRVGR